MCYAHSRTRTRMVTTWLSVESQNIPLTQYAGKRWYTVERTDQMLAQQCAGAVQNIYPHNNESLIQC